MGTIHPFFNAFTPSKKTPMILDKTKITQKNLIANSHLQHLKKDTIQFSGNTKPSESEKSSATQYIDNLLTQCDQETSVERMTFRDFLVNAKLNPKRYLPTASSYFLDAVDHYDGPNGPETIQAYGETMPRFNMMNAPWNRHLSDPTHIYGHEPAVNRVLEIVRAFKQQPNPDRGIALFGPHGSGKSAIAKCLMAGLEDFSKQPEGALWTYSFVFPNGEKLKPQSPQEADQWMKAVAGSPKLLEPDQVAAQLMANLNLNPIFLLPPKQRIHFLKELQAEGKIEPDFNIDYYLKANLEGNAQRVLDKLHHLYSEDPQKFQKALAHVQVERWTMSAQNYRGLVEVPASRNPDAVLRETPGEPGKMPDLIRTAGKRTLDGLMPKANRGVFYLDDFGRNGIPYDHLLMPLETGEVTLQEIHGGPGIAKEQLDFIPILSVNPEILERAKKHGAFNALEQRLLFVPVPLERRYKEEAQIMQPVINRAKARGKEIAPDTLEAFALWVTMTRLFPTQKNHTPYRESSQRNKDFASALNKLTPLGKALLYAGESIPSLCTEEQQALEENIKAIAQEHNQSLGETEFTLYEGGVGLSSRGAMNILKQVTTRAGNDPISFLDMFEAIARFTDNKPLYEAKRNQILKEKNKNIAFPSGLELLKEVEDYQRQKFMEQLKNALGMYQESSVYVDRIQRYGDHIAALQDKKSVPPRSQVDGDPKPDLSLIRSFENMAHSDKRLSDRERAAYRSTFLTRAMEWEPDQSETENITRIYKDELGAFRTLDEQQNKQYLTEFRNNVKILLKNPKTFDHLKGQPATDRMEAALKNLKALGYSPEVLPKILDWALENRYVADQVKAQHSDA